VLKAGKALERKAYPEKAAPPINWGLILDGMESQMVRLRNQKKRIEAKGWVEQTDLKERFQELSRNMEGIFNGNLMVLQKNRHSGVNRSPGYL